MMQEELRSKVAL